MDFWCLLPVYKARAFPSPESGRKAWILKFPTIPETELHFSGHFIFLKDGHQKTLLSDMGYKMPYHWANILSCLVCAFTCHIRHIISDGIIIIMSIWWQKLMSAPYGIQCKSLAMKLSLFWSCFLDFLPFRMYILTPILYFYHSGSKTSYLAAILNFSKMAATPYGFLCNLQCTLCVYKHVWVPRLCIYLTCIS